MTNTALREKMDVWRESQFHESYVECVRVGKKTVT